MLFYMIEIHWRAILLHISALMDHIYEQINNNSAYLLYLLLSTSLIKSNPN